MKTNTYYLKAGKARARSKELLRGAATVFELMPSDINAYYAFERDVNDRLADVVKRVGDHIYWALGAIEREEEQTKGKAAASAITSFRTSTRP